MNHCNYTIFETLKYQLEFIECLEYCMDTYKPNKKEIKKNYFYLKDNLEEGTYKNIISKLFTDYQTITQELTTFFAYYKPSKIIKMAHSKKASIKINYIKNMINCYESLKNITLTFTNEPTLKKETIKEITQLFKTCNERFYYFLYFIVYGLFINQENNNNKIKYKKDDIKDIVSIIKYCNDNININNSIKILENNDELKINNEFERLSNKCIELENKQSQEIKSIINILNTQIQKKQ